MDNQYGTLSEATNALQKKGYELDFTFKPEAIVCKAINKTYEPEDFHIDEFHRFEGMSNPDDMSVVYAVTTVDGNKGMLIDAYGAYSSLSQKMIQKIRIH
ncbi:phosphoribosylpyrophosphate synthetase [Owenweeksia hongkongensis]|uniref:phosphoribosylpyrophosphate synthetase n=1 Tax=Owenweeksia hongkongensis TaxID=253245 RepID=UPI003A909419